MTPDLCVDIGNTRIKWGWLGLNGERRFLSLQPDDEAEWSKAFAGLGKANVSWAVAGVHPDRRDRFARWAASHGNVLVIDDYRQLPLRVEVEEPARVGMDRLLNAVGFWHHLGGDSNTPGIVIDVGTAVTVDLILEGNRFVGGAILPGPRLMFDALHRHTALLPRIELAEVPDVAPPGKNTRDAMGVGVMAAVVGAAEFLVREYASAGTTPPWVMLTGGAVGSLTQRAFANGGNVLHDPHLTLDGIRQTALALP